MVLEGRSKISHFNNRTTGISLFIEGYTEEKQTLNHTNGLVRFIITLMLCKDGSVLFLHKRVSSVEQVSAAGF